MNVIYLDNGSLILRSEESKKLVNQHIQAGSFWEYVSVLIEQDVQRSHEEVNFAQMMETITSLQQTINLLVANGGTPTHAVVSSPIGNVGSEIAATGEKPKNKDQIDLKNPKVKGLGLLSSISKMRGRE